MMSERENQIVGCSGTHHPWSVSQPATPACSVHRTRWVPGQGCGAVVSGGAVVLMDEPAQHARLIGPVRGGSLSGATGPSRPMPR
jgi:hypothetical protein